MFLNVIPVSLAANEDAVLTTIGHGDTDTVTLSGSVRNVTLTVPYGYVGTAVDLTSGLAITYDQTAYKSVVATPTFPGTAQVGDTDYVAVTVSFQRLEEDDGVPKSQTVYYVRVVRADAEAPTFSGVISKEVSRGSTLPLSAADFGTYYERNDGNVLGSVKISGSNLVTGTLAYTGGDVFQDNIDFTGALTFQALDVGTVSYDVTAYAQGDTVTPVGTAVLTITVYSTPSAGTYAGSVYTGASKSYSALGLSACFDLRSGGLTTLELTPSGNDYGTWYLGSTALTAGTAHTVDASQLSGLSFKGTAVGIAAFTWRVANEAGFSDYAAGTIVVSAATITPSSYSASGRVTKGSIWNISTSQLSYSPSSVAISYIKISSIPAAADGYLCLSTALARSTEYGYPAIGANVALAAGAVIPYQYIQYLKIVTKSTATGSTLSFTWTATTNSMASSAIWSSAAYYTLSFATGGTVSCSADMNIPLTLDASDFSTEYANATGYALSYVTFTPPTKTSGTLYYNYNVSSRTGTAVTAATKYYTGSSPNLSYITFLPANNYTGTVSIPYAGYRSDGTSVAGKLVITVSNSSGGTFSYTIDKNDALQLDAADFAAAFLSAAGENLSYVRFTLPSSSCGKLYYDYTSSSNYDATVSSSTKYYVYSSPYLSYVSFVPYEDYTGMVTIRFSAYDSDGDSHSGKLIVFVVDSPAGIVDYTAKINGTVALSADDFSREFISVTGSVLSYVVFVPPAATAGTLYTGYSAESGTGTKVTASTKFYNGASPDISDITFVPAANYTGRAEIKYTVYTASGLSYVGKLKITVGETGSGSVTYSIKYNTALALHDSDFVSKFYAGTGGSSLTCVSFTPPSSSYGKLYYGYTPSSGYGSAVTSGTLYYVSSAPYLSNITFVPKTGYSGSFTVGFTGYATDGTGYAGKLTITVGSKAGTVNYEVTYPDTLTFSASDFREALEDSAGETLQYIKFILPDSSEGTLYYGYSLSSSYTSAVSASTRYYASSYPYLSNVTFVPKAGYSGTVTIEYTAYDTDGDSYDAMVLIAVSGNAGGTVEYETGKNTPVTFSSSDFNTAFVEETGSNLYYVKFTLPSSAQGQLYYKYKSPTSYTSKISASSGYYRSSSPLISDITFVPYSSYTGTVTIAYTGYSTGGTAYAGTLCITVIDPDVHPFTDVSAGYAWADAAIAYLYHQSVVTGVGGNRFAPGDKMSRGDFILMMCRAFAFEAASDANFSDVVSGSYYYDAILTAKALGIAQSGDGRFYPAKGITRQDAAVFIYRALNVSGVYLQTGTADDLSGFSDAGQIMDSAVTAMATLVRNGILVGSGGTLNPEGIVSRAEMAVILYRALMI